eukprot:scaffold313322_cov20-Prasinocladus_malaysianus.AAC.1
MTLRRFRRLVLKIRQRGRYPGTSGQPTDRRLRKPAICQPLLTGRALRWLKHKTPQLLGG